jgi:hypothetical protein
MSDSSKSDWDEAAPWIIGFLVVCGILKEAYDYLRSPAGAPARSALEIAVIGAAAVGTIGWQIDLFDKDDWKFPKRLAVPISLSATMLIGVLIRGGMRLHDHHVNNYGFGHLCVEILAVVAISAIVSLKTYFGPLFLGATFIQLVYNGFEFGHLVASKLAVTLLNFILPGLPQHMQIIYTVIAAIGVFGACTWESVWHALTE